MTQVKVAEAFVVGFVIESFFYGVFVSLFISAIYLQVQKIYQKIQVNRVLLFASIYFFVGITAFWILEFVSFASAFIQNSDAALAQLSGVHDPTIVARLAVYHSQVIVGDFVMIYRLYHVYGQKIWICILPIITTIVLTFVGSIIAWKAARSNGPPASASWSTVNWSLILFNNIYCCVLIVFLLQRSKRNLNLLAPSRMMRVIRIFVESAALWATSVILAFISSLVGSNLERSFFDITVPIIGISFCLIIVRSSSGDGDSSGKVSSGVPTNYSLRHIAVSVDRHTEVSRIPNDSTKDFYNSEPGEITS